MNSQMTLDGLQVLPTAPATLAVPQDHFLLQAGEHLYLATRTGGGREVRLQRFAAREARQLERVGVGTGCLAGAGDNAALASGSDGGGWRALPLAAPGLAPVSTRDEPVAVLPGADGCLYVGTAGLELLRYLSAKTGKWSTRGGKVLLGPDQAVPLKGRVERLLADGEAILAATTEHLYATGLRGTDESRAVPYSDGTYMRRAPGIRALRVCGDAVVAVFATGAVYAFEVMDASLLTLEANGVTRLGNVASCKSMPGDALLLQMAANPYGTPKPEYVVYRQGTASEPLDGFAALPCPGSPLVYVLDPDAGRLDAWPSTGLEAASDREPCWSLDLDDGEYVEGGAVRGLFIVNGVAVIDTDCRLLFVGIHNHKLLEENHENQ